MYIYIYVPFFLICSYIFSIHTVSLLFGATLQNFIYKHTLELKKMYKGIRKKENLHDIKNLTACNRLAKLIGGVTWSGGSWEVAS